MAKFKPCTVLVIGDSHVDDEQSLDRFASLGGLIVDRKPTHILSIGDFLSFHCFSGWDKKYRLKMEGRRRTKEIKAGNKALDLMLNPMIKQNKRSKKSKKAAYKPELIYVEGNHEEWEQRYLDENPELVGTLDYRSGLSLEERGFIHVPYREYHEINGVGFTHVPMNKLNRPIGGVRVMRTALESHSSSVVFGHSHELKIEGQHRHGAEHYQQALNVGCFFEHIDDYAKGSKTDYWRGVILLHMYSEERFDIECVSMSRLMSTYK